jgi:hypothetical protein
MAHETNFKPARSSRIDKRRAKLDRKAQEDKEMAVVRRRDKRCRFPLCGCGKLKLTLQVSHKEHRGMGGNPAGDRTDRRTMVLVCIARHRGNSISLDRGTLKWEPVNADLGANGPIEWYEASPDGWDLLAAERTPGVLREPPYVLRERLLQLAQMEE